MNIDLARKQSEGRRGAQVPRIRRGMVSPDEVIE
jgi:hypothetical protein